MPLSVDWYIGVGGLTTDSWLIEWWLSIDWDVYWVSNEWWLTVNWEYQSTLDCECFLLTWSVHSKQFYCHYWFMKVRIPQLKNLPLKVCASLISFSLTAPTLLDSTFKVIFFDLYVAMASLMASIEPSTSPKWQRKNNALHQSRIPAMFRTLQTFSMLLNGKWTLFSCYFITVHYFKGMGHKCLAA